MLTKLIAQAFVLLFNDEQRHTVTAFLPPLSKVKERVRVTRAKNGNGFHVEIGRPNYSERKFLKLCKKAKTNPSRYLIKYFKDK